MKRIYNTNQEGVNTPVVSKSLNGLPVFEEIPKGWVIVNATTVPNGYKMISNNNSRFYGNRKLALIPDFC
jgi:hypothetical protein